MCLVSQSLFQPAEATGTGQVAGREEVVALELLPGEGNWSTFIVSLGTRSWGLESNSSPLDLGLSSIGSCLWKGIHFEVILKET